MARFISKRFDRSLKTPFRNSTIGDNGSTRKLNNQEIGALGEKLAATWLTQRGLKVLWRNFKAEHGGEVDLVCRDNDTLVFVEVKARTSEFFGQPAAAVDSEKERQITRGALAWLRGLHQADLVYRFDILEIILVEGKPPKPNLISNAFQLPDDYYL
ncbi:MAG: YraN family protein [Verrucomicrobiota bacterium]